MSKTLTAKLNKQANEFQAGSYIGFGFTLGEQYYDREAKERKWTNYRCAIFTNNTQQIEYYRRSLVEGAIVTVWSEAAKIHVFEGNQGPMYSIDLQSCKVVSILGVQQPAQPQPIQQAPTGVQQPPQPNAYQQAQAGHPQPAPQPSNAFQDFDDDIPF